MIFLGAMPGPQKVWEWSHQLDWGLAGQDRFKEMRDCGCVFWDEKRFDLVLPWEASWFDFDFETEERIAMLAPTLEEQKRSWEIRADLFADGITGYWEEKNLKEEEESA